MKNTLNASNKARINREIEALSTKYTEILKQLIQFNSIKGQEGPIQDFMAEHFHRLHLKPRVILSRSDQNSKNVVAVLSGTDGLKHKSLVLNAHCDIAPVDDVCRWKHPPFEGLIADGKIFGRGAQDDKAGLALLLLITETLKRLKITLKGDLILQSVIEDETSGDGTKSLTDSGYVGDGVIICDGTWPERIIYSHLGQVWLNVVVTGEPVAACVQERGVNPIYLAMDFINRLKEEVHRAGQKVKMNFSKG
jgi:acetylornithine deacetylase